MLICTEGACRLSCEHHLYAQRFFWKFDVMCRWHNYRYLLFALIFSIYLMFCASFLRRNQNSRLTQSSVLGQWKFSTSWQKSISTPPPSTNLCRGFLQLFSFQSHLWFHHLFPIFQPLSTTQSKHKTVSNTEPTPMKNINLCFHSNFKNFFQCSHKTTCKFSLALSYTLSTYILIIFH